MSWVFALGDIKRCPTSQDGGDQWDHKVVVHKKHLAFHFMRSMQQEIKAQTASNATQAVNHIQ